MKTLLKIIGGLVGLFVFVFLIFFIKACNDPTIGERGNAQSAIELCWKEQGRKSLTPGEQRFIAGACEKMEEKFEAKYGVKP